VILKLSSCSEKEFEECYTALNNLINDFSVKYPDLQNLEKFG
jgi:hypothetical protein